MVLVVALATKALWGPAGWVSQPKGVFAISGILARRGGGISDGGINRKRGEDKVIGVGVRYGVGVMVVDLARWLIPDLERRRCRGSGRAHGGGGHSSSGRNGACTCK